MSYTGTPPITLFFGPGENYRVIGKTVLKEEGFSSKWENLALKNARVRLKTVLKEERLYIASYFNIKVCFLQNMIFTL